MPPTIFPSDGDHGASPGDGKLGNEINMGAWAAALTGERNHVVSGLRPVQAGNDVTVQTGVVVIQGHRVVQDSTSFFASVDSGTPTVYWLRLGRTGGQIDGTLVWTPETNFSTEYADGVRVFAWTGVFLLDVRRGPPISTSGSYTGDGVTASERTIEVYRDGIKPAQVVVTGASSSITGFSPLYAHDLLTADSDGVCVTFWDSDRSTFARRVRSSSAWDPGSIVAGSFVEAQFTVTGAEVGDPVAVGFTSLPVGHNSWSVTAFVSAADEVTVVLQNLGGTNEDPPSGNVDIVVTKEEVSRDKRVLHSSAPSLVPLQRGSVALAAGGFNVIENLSVIDSLNRSGEDYRWVAIL